MCEQMLSAFLPGGSNSIISHGVGKCKWKKETSTEIKWGGDGKALFIGEWAAFLNLISYFVQKNGENAFNLWFDKSWNRWYNIITVRQGSESGRAKKFKEIWKKSLTNLKESDIIVKLSQREIAKTASWKLNNANKKVTTLEIPLWE